MESASHRPDDSEGQRKLSTVESCPPAPEGVQRTGDQTGRSVLQWLDHSVFSGPDQHIILRLVMVTRTFETLGKIPRKVIWVEKPCGGGIVLGGLIASN